MPAETVVVLTVVIAMFATFMVVLGAVWIWCNLPAASPRRAEQAAPRATRRPALH